MAANEVRVASEGELRLVQASGFSGAWATAAGVVGKLLAFCSDLRQNWQPPTYEWVRDRGVLSHAKRTNDGGPYEWEANVLVVNTGSLTAIATASGASVPKVHLEYKSITREDGALTAVYYMLHHAILMDQELTERPEGNQYRLRFQGQTAVFATASGYLA